MELMRLCLFYLTMMLRGVQLLLGRSRILDLTLLLPLSNLEVMLILV
ncbi:hypothetical protein MtrunA17_Chr6g0469801 [Medicago truncatula]|uniref:Uncharacterized protein n=1 Tax=Medicago truncatula TaxID=3880 RepID=A0A396HG35_MEDTR|nr:hypothetical protein MtrunA17_Chr6g0469801 [Medicago truncatula]